MNELIPYNLYQVIYENKCLKLKTSHNDYIYYQIAQHKETGAFVVCIMDNDRTGLYSKEWITFDDIHTLLSPLKSNFRSREFNQLFQSKSRNNAGFLVAILKSNEIGLLQNALGYHFQYMKVEHYDKQIVKLQKWLLDLAKSHGEVKAQGKKSGQ